MKINALIKSNTKINENLYEMKLSLPVPTNIIPGQFINIKLDEHFLRRPISIYDYYDDTLVIVYKVVGEGTTTLTKKQPGEILDILAPLGNGFENLPENTKVDLIGGGIGIAPLYFLAKELVNNKNEIDLYLGFNSKNDLFAIEAFENLGCNVKIYSQSGEIGSQGNCLQDYTSTNTYYACGPKPMLEALMKLRPTNGFLSLEERMGCGFGACMACTCKTKTKNGKVCLDGPIFKVEELIYE